MSEEKPAADDPIDSLAQGFKGAQVLFTGHRLGVFRTLGEEGARTAAEIAGELGLDHRGCRILCDALAALDLLDKDAADRYRNGAAVRERLLPGSPRPLGNMLLLDARLYGCWGGLAGAVRDGRPAAEERVDPDLATGERAFAAAMADIGRDSAEAVAAALDLSGARKLLDVGGGPGIYAVTLAGRWPRLEAEVLDRPETAAMARETIERAGLGDRVRARGGDAFESDLGGPWDAIFTSNFLHIFPPEANRRLVERCARALAPGGILAVKDMFLDPGRTSPRGTALFAVNMLVVTEGGQAYALDEVRGWMEDAGLVWETVLPLTPQSSIAVARKTA